MHRGPFTILLAHVKGVTTLYGKQDKSYYLYGTDKKTGYRASGVNKWFITENAIYIISAFKSLHRG